MSPKGRKKARQFPLIGRVCYPLSGGSRFRRKRELQLPSNLKRFFWILSLRGELEAG
jgi:hypothetical protein